MLKKFFNRQVANLENLTYVSGAIATREWPDGTGRDIEEYNLEKSSTTGEWNLVHKSTASNADIGFRKIVASVPKLEDAVRILRGVLQTDFKPHYAGYFNWKAGATYREYEGDKSLRAVERALRQKLVP